METIQRKRQTQQEVGHEVSKRRDKDALRNKRSTNRRHGERRHSVSGAQRKLTKPV